MQATPVTYHATPGPVRFLRALLRIVRGRPRIPPSLVDNALLASVLNRRSVRRFTSAPISDDAFAAILEAGRLAPSTVNLQTWSFAVFDRSSWQATFGAPLPFAGQRAIVVLGDTHRVRNVLHFPDSPLVEYTTGVINASLAAMNMAIAAEALGISSLMLSDTGRTGLLDAAFLRTTLALPDRVVPLMTMVFGYASGGRPPMPPKLPGQTIAFEGKYAEADPGVMAVWLEEMMAGYKATKPGSSFARQLDAYRAKLDGAEAALRACAGLEPLMAPPGRDASVDARPKEV